MQAASCDNSSDIFSVLYFTKRYGIPYHGLMSHSTYYGHFGDDFMGPMTQLTLTEGQWLVN